MKCRIILSIAIGISLILLSAGEAWHLSHQPPVFNLVRK
jgi:hypothetical protein